MAACFCVVFVAMKSIIIPLNDWAAGERKFHAHADLEFFQQFDNSEILDANVSVEIPVEAHPSEVLTPSAVEVEWDLSHAVYDFVCLSLPLQRLHPEGQCDPNTVRFLSHKERGNEEAEAAAVPRSSDH